jgi:hypothetical protein
VIVLTKALDANQSDDEVYRVPVTVKTGCFVQVVSGSLPEGSLFLG